MNTRIPPAAWVLAAGLAVVALSPLLSGYWAFKLGTVIVYVLAVRSLQFLIGGSGQISLGHSAFIAIGAYVGGALVALGLSASFLSHPVAALACGVIGFAFGWPAVRLVGPYLALATFALAIALPQLFKHPALEAFTGGVSGLSLDANAWATWFGTIKAEHVALYECVVWGCLAWLALARIVAGPAGVAWYALRDQPVAATAAGVNVRFWKATAFGLSAALAGLAGSLNTALTHFVSPDSYGVYLSLFLLVGVSIAGSTSGLGAVAGALFLVFVPDIAERINKDATGFIFGAIMLACVYITPGGAWLRQRLARLRGRKPSFPEEQEIN